MVSNSCNIDATLPDSRAYKKAGRHSKPGGSTICMEGITIGGREFIVMAGPCAVESREQLISTARAVHGHGADILRGGAFKPRSSPYSFQGLEEEGLKLLQETGKITGMPVITEVMDTRLLDKVCQYADILQIGSRNMQNFPLLKEAGNCRKPVMLKRGMNATIDEFLFASEYILNGGNEQVMLCERGIRTFERAYRNMLDLNAIPMLKKLSHLPVIVDPSHGTGYAWMVPFMAKAAMAAGADGLLVEVHYKPEEALCDGTQSLRPDQFRDMMNELHILGKALGRNLLTAESSFM